MGRRGVIYNEGASMKQKITAAITGLGVLLLAFIYTGCLYDIVELPERVLLVEPYITHQPESLPLRVGDPSPTELSVTIEGWDPLYGELSYQWYTFPSLFAYLTGSPAPLGPGNPPAAGEGSTLSLSGLATSPAVARNYFYVEVTNTNPQATNKQHETLTSEVAVISFNDIGPNVPELPIITRQPAKDTQARFGSLVRPLSVRAVLAAPDPTSELFYQWYSIDVDENTGAFSDSKSDADNTPGDGIPDMTPVAGATVSTFTPIAQKLDDSFYLVKVTHTIGRIEAVEDDPATPDVNETVVGDPGYSSVEWSVPATVNIQPGLRAGTPVINVQPKPALYILNEVPARPVEPLTVEAVSPDQGTLTFAWYYHTSAASSGGKAVTAKEGTVADPVPLPQPDGTTVYRSSFTPVFPADGDVSTFFYVVVTNTNTNVVKGGTTKASAAARAVHIRRQTGAVPASNAVLTLTPNQRFQYIRGYGGMEVAWANFPETFPEDTELQYNPDRLGFNILRIMLPVSNVNIDVAMDDLVNVTRRRPHYYDNVKIVNKYGGYVLASPWSPPKEWKSNNSINGGGYLRPQYYKDYAAYLKSYAMHMNNRGAPIYAISIQNEPNYTAGYDGCEWTPNEMRDFFIQAGRFTEGVRGWGGGVQIPRVLTMNGESANNVDINWPAIDSAVAYANIDMFARHVYGDRKTNLWASRQKVRKQTRDDDGKDVWMTEHNINSANAAGYYNDSKWDYIWKFMNDIDLVMRLNNENAFVWWASKRFYSMVGDGQYGTPAGLALPRGWGLSHYAKYTIDTTRIGFTLTGTTGGGTAINAMDAGNSVVNADFGANDMDSTSARITAYISQDGNEISLVMWTPTLNSGSGGHDMGTIQINMPTGFLIGGATGIESYKNSATSNTYQAPYAVPVSTDRTKAYVRLPNSRIMSVKFTKQE